MAFIKKFIKKPVSLKIIGNGEHYCNSDPSDGHKKFYRFSQTGGRIIVSVPRGICIARLMVSVHDTWDNRHF